jgi:glutamate dehydrogenase
MVELESHGLLERQLEALPSGELMAERIAAGHGMTRPELCVLLAYAKRLLREQVIESSLPDDPYLGAALAEYFPPLVVERFGHLLPYHPLRREIIATLVTNDVINSMGITFVPRMAAETGATPEEVARAFLVARDVSRARDPWDAVERLDAVVPGDIQAGLMDNVDSLVEQLARWYLQNVHDIDLTAEVERGQPAFAELVQTLTDSATDAWRVATDGRLEELLEQDVPNEPARFGAVAPALVYAPDIMAVAQATGRSIPAVTRAFFTIGERLYLDLIEARAASLPAADRWQRMAWDTLLDDLRLLRRQIVERVIAESKNGSIDDAVDAYLSTRSDPYDRLSRMMENVTTAPPDDSSMVMVAVHQIRQVAS